MKIIINILIILVNITLYAQSDSIKEALKFYPLQIGDYWQYNVTKNSFGIEPDTSWIGYKEVIGDTLMPNNKNYFVVKEDKIPFQSSKIRLIRTELTTANVYEYDSYYNAENIIDSLLSKKGDFYLGYKCTSDTLKYYFDLLVRAKLIQYYLISSTHYDGWELAQGFGEVMRYFDDVGTYAIHYQCDLIYAKIDGTKYGIKTDIKESEKLLNQFSLYQNYPNPFNPATNIGFRIAEFGFVSLKIYDILGREVNFVNEEKLAGNYEVKFDASGLSSGIYFYKLSTENYTSVKKMILMK